MSETTQPDAAALRALAEGLIANDPLDPLTMGRVANMKAGPLILKLARAVLALLTTLADLRARLAAVEGALPREGPYSGRPILGIDWWLEHPRLELDQNDVCLVGYDDLHDLKQQRDTARAALGRAHR